MLKEYAARGNYIFPPRPSMRLTVDIFRYCRERLPRFNTISISGYHIREAGSSAAQELAFTLANGIAYVEAAVAAGLDVDAFAPRLSFFFNAHNDVFVEVAKFRAARRLWARIMRERFGAQDERSQMLRFHAQTGGSTLTAQQPANNVVRVALQAFSAAGRRLPVAAHERLRRGARAADRAVGDARAAHAADPRAESGVTDVADPFGGSYYVEALTDALEARGARADRGDRRAAAARSRRSSRAGCRIASSRRPSRRSGGRAGDLPIVGVNTFVAEGERIEPELHQIDPAVGAAAGRSSYTAHRAGGTRLASSDARGVAAAAAEDGAPLCEPLRRALDRRDRGGDVRDAAGCRGTFDAVLAGRA